MLCSCGCGIDVTRRTELRHLQGKAAPHIKANQVARLSLIAKAPAKWQAPTPVDGNASLHKRFRVHDIDDRMLMLIDPDPEDDDDKDDDNLLPSQPPDHITYDPPSSHEQAPESDSPSHMENAADAAASATSIQDQHWQESHHQATVEDVSDEEADGLLSGSEEDEDYPDSEEDSDNGEGISVFDRINTDFERELA
jgi:hypothetical protein